MKVPNFPLISRKQYNDTMLLSNSTRKLYMICLSNSFIVSNLQQPLKVIFTQKRKLLEGRHRVKYTYIV